MKLRVRFLKLIPVTLLLILIPLLTGCDFDIVNPGPTDDVALDEEGAHESVVNGMRYSFARALGDLAYIGSEPAHEITTAGRVFPVKLPSRPGQLLDNEINRQWEFAHQARWSAEEGVRRFERVMEADFDSSDLAATALMYAGFSNRLLGENMCYAVIDEGEAEPYSVHLQRAEDNFTQAISVAQAAGATEVAEASRAGRAQVRLLRGDHAGAAQDAGAIADDFLYEARYFTATSDQYNILYWTNDNNPYRAHSAWDTYYEEYYEDTGDPRVRWGFDPDEPVGEFEDIPWYFQLKYPQRSANIPIAKGAEMRLIESENELEEGNWDVAMQIINDVRSEVVSDHDGDPIPEWEASNEEEAWTHLKRERGIVLWLEARRLGDLRRWIEAGTPGDMEDMDGRSTCFPISENERQSNPNIPLN